MDFMGPLFVPTGKVSFRIFIQPVSCHSDPGISSFFRFQVNASFMQPYSTFAQVASLSNQVQLLRGSIEHWEN
jgi:hypothetical protein